MTINLHELANMPGYGKAQPELRKAGLWDDHPADMLRNDIQDALSAIERAHINSLKLKDAKQ